MIIIIVLVTLLLLQAENDSDPHRNLFCHTYCLLKDLISCLNMEKSRITEFPHPLCVPTLSWFEQGQPLSKICMNSVPSADTSTSYFFTFWQSLFIVIFNIK
jgi:hypothetical protein